MTEYEALEEYSEIEILSGVRKILDTGALEFNPKKLMGDILHHFTNNVPAYNKELEEENRVLRDQIEAFVEFNDALAYKASEMVGIYKKDQMLKQMRGK